MTAADAMNQIQKVLLLDLQQDLFKATSSLSVRCAVTNVGAVINRPAAKCCDSTLVSGEFVTSCCRADDIRPYGVLSKEPDKLEFVAPTVGAVINRPAVTSYVSTLGFGEFVTFYCRADDIRPYGGVGFCVWNSARFGTGDPSPTVGIDSAYESRGDCHGLGLCNDRGVTMAPMASPGGKLSA